MDFRTYPKTYLTEEERRLIDEAVAAGRVTVCPPHKRAYEIEYLYKDGKLVSVNGPTVKEVNNGHWNRVTAAADKRTKEREERIAKVEAFDNLGYTTSQIAIVMDLTPRAIREYKAELRKRAGNEGS